MTPSRRPSGPRRRASHLRCGSSSSTVRILPTGHGPGPAADIFTSLSDNIQETFGLTPVEAMAAGLPCVVSDWNGYKDTVRDGVDGFRVPVHTPPPGSGGDLADRFDLGVADYDHYIGEASLFTAVDVEAAAEAYRRLITSPDLRRTMGEAGRKRAAEIYDWAFDLPSVDGAVGGVGRTTACGFPACPARSPAPGGPTGMTFRLVQHLPIGSHRPGDADQPWQRRHERGRDFPHRVKERELCRSGSPQ